MTEKHISFFEISNVLRKRGIELIVCAVNDDEPSKFGCSNCGHEWNCHVSEILQTPQCPECFKRSSSRKAPRYSSEEAANIAEQHNLQLIHYGGYAKRNAKFKCRICGHLFETRFQNISQNSQHHEIKCPNCRIKSQEPHQEALMAQTGFYWIVDYIEQIDSDERQKVVYMVYVFYNSQANALFARLMETKEKPLAWNSFPLAAFILKHPLAKFYKVKPPTKKTPETKFKL
jgi:DNA-directed RNA polymerase subunit RPC12/RpoP